MTFKKKVLQSRRSLRYGEVSLALPPRFANAFGWTPRFARRFRFPGEPLGSMCLTRLCFVAGRDAGRGVQMTTKLSSKGILSSSTERSN
jgi:hypothetical protein